VRAGSLKKPEESMTFKLPRTLAPA